MFGYIERVGATRTEVYAALGRPDSSKAFPRQNEYDSTVTDTVVTLYYPGLTVDLFVFPHGNGGFAASLDVRGARSDMPLGLGVGASCSRLPATLGTPIYQDSIGHRAFLRYVGEGADQLQFECESGVVSRIQWHPYID